MKIKLIVYILPFFVLNLTLGASALAREFKNNALPNFIPKPMGLPWEDYRSSASDSFAASAGLSYDTYGLTQWLLRGHMGASEYGLANTIRNFTGNQSPYVSMDEANKEAEGLGLTFNRPVRRNSLDILIEAKRKEIAREDILRRSNHPLASLSGALLGKIFDPIMLFMAAAIIYVFRRRMKALRDGDEKAIRD
ncbi:MAG: hypothetical protein KDI13_03170 [Alphaproteobacteria bacterium]|nr:hypothetical protein [Alphaproteobacteria bacterium]